jgi:hypothetical protein
METDRKSAAANRRTSQGIGGRGSAGRPGICWRDDHRRRGFPGDAVPAVTVVAVEQKAAITRTSAGQRSYRRM